VDATDDRGSDIMLGTLLEGTLKYEEARLPRVDMDDRSGPGRRIPSGVRVSGRADQEVSIQTSIARCLQHQQNLVVIEMFEGIDVINDLRIKGALARVSW
jgi:hypothetical protein